MADTFRDGIEAAAELLDGLAAELRKRGEKCATSEWNEDMSNAGQMDALAADIRALTPPPASGETEATRLMRVIERDRSAVAAATANIKRTIASYEWLCEPGKGSYAYDDDRWRSEFGDAIRLIRDGLVPLKRIAADLSDSPTDWAEVQRARANTADSPASGDREALVARAERAKADAAEMRAVVEAALEWEQTRRAISCDPNSLTPHIIARRNLTAALAALEPTP